MSKKLQGKVALVTGGSRGIGAATARALAEEGASIAISYASSADKAESLVRELNAAGTRAQAFRADQADLAQASELISAVHRAFGRLDILVNNAAVFAIGPVANTGNGESGFDRQHTINFSSVVAAIRAASGVMEDGGRIISVGSGVSTRVGFGGLADYAATKAGIVGYSKGAARDLAGRNITVNVVQPGFVNTDMNPESSEYAPVFNATTAIGRYARPEEIAAGIVFLASPQASYVTGAVLNIDGGYNA